MWRRKKRSFVDFKEEIECHLAMEADQIRDTAPSVDPETAARQAFGNVTAAQERWYEHSHWMFFDYLSRDLRQGLRQIKRRPGFCVTVILTLAFGIGANSAVFSIVEAVLLRPLPYKDPSRLAMIFSGDPARELHEGRVSLLNFADWRNQNRSFEDMTAFIGQTFLLRTGGLPERMRSARVEANFWPLLGVEPLLGRVFTAEEEKRGERVAVLSYQLWQEQFGGAVDALGSRLTMDDRSYLVIGVMPQEFRFPFPDTRVWEPVTAHPYWMTRDRGPRSDSVWLVLGRIKRDVSWSRAQGEMDAIARRLRSEYSGDEMPASIPVVPLDIQTTGKFRLSLWLLLGSVFLMLLIACINVAGLLLARGAVRDREFAVRRALGAGRLRIAGQVLTETLLLSTCGGLLGLLLASIGAGLIRALWPGGHSAAGGGAHRLDGHLVYGRRFGFHGLTCERMAGFSDQQDAGRQQAMDVHVHAARGRSVGDWRVRPGADTGGFGNSPDPQLFAPARSGTGISPRPSADHACRSPCGKDERSAGGLFRGGDPARRGTFRVCVPPVRFRDS